MKTQRHLIIISLITIFFFCLANRAKADADNIYTYSQSSGTRTITLTTSSNPPYFYVNGGATEYTHLGNITVSGGTLNLVFSNTTHITLHGQIKVTNGTLNISSTTSATDQHLLRRHANKNAMILLDNSNSSASQCVLTITGSEDNPFVIDGDSGELTIDYNETDGYTITAPGENYQTNGQIIRINGSTATLTDVVLQNVYSKDSQNGGGIDVNEKRYGSSDTYTGVNVHLIRCVIKNCRGYGNAAAINFNVKGTTGSTFEMEDCEVTGCFSANGNGIIRSTNANKCSLKMTNCNVNGNYNTSASGTFQTGAICWNTFYYDLSMTNCNVTNNWTKGNGGGIVIMSRATLTNCTIENNIAQEKGGGIFLRTYSNSGGVYEGKSITVTLNNTTIKENTARDAGGGIYLIVDRMQKPPGQSGYLANLTYTLDVNGGSIEENESLSGGGGGIYVERGSNCNYATEVNVNGNETYGNSVIQFNNASSYGGGIDLGSNITLNLNGSSTNTVSINNNTAGSASYGGGIYKNGSVCVVGKVEINNNTVSSTANNVYIPSDASQPYVNIGSSGLECGSKIGITKEAGFIGTTPSDYTEIAGGTASNCIDAFNNHYFFDDTDTHGVYTSSNSPYTTTRLYFLGSGLSNSWLSNADVSGCTVTDGYVTSVNSAAGLAYLAKDVASGKNYAGKAVSLTADINLSGHNWEPFGSGSCSSCSFSGTFDGQGHTITGLTLGAFPYENVGLFGHVTGTVKNVVINGSVTGSGATNLGGITGNLDGGTIYNCMVQGTPTGGTNLGALVGNITSGTVENCFAISDAPLCGSGTVTNCYVRLASGGDEDNMGTATNVGASGSTSGAFTETVTPYLYRHDDNKVGSAALLTLLNQWVDAQSTPTDLAHWTRTCASPINGDYPLLKFDGMKCVGTKSGSNDVLTYCNSLNTMLTTHNASGDNIFFWGSESGVSNGNSDANVYFDEDAALIHTSTIANAYVGVWLDNTAGDGGAQPSQGGTDAIDWHLFSSALDNLPIGFTYNTSSYTPGYGHTPPAVTFDDPKTGYFPTNLGSYYSEWDFYSYAEPDYHWVNMKRASDDHWHSDYDHWPIHYDNEAHFVSGRGYLVATAEDCFLQGYGTLKKGDVTHPLSYTAGIAYTKRQGFNVLGNPYQSYLDFDRFAHTNSDIWKGGVTESGYIVMDEDQGGYVCYAHGASENHYGANRYIHPHQGFIVMACETAPTTVTFNENMRSVDGTASFRDQRLNYPLVNLIVTEASGNRDLCTVELGRPDKGGLVKAKGVKAGKGSVYCHFEDEDWAIVFTHPGLSEIGIRFETPEDDTFTLTWDTENGDFHYLHLIDNLTGSDIDCLTTDEYRFTAKADDYNSRFRLVFGYTGIEEPESPEPVEGPTTFAFMMGGQLVVNGEGILRLFDVTGRMMTEETVSGTQTVRSLPDTAGIYVLQLVGSNETKTQKIVKQ